MKTLTPIIALLILTASLSAEEPKTVRIIASPETTYFTEPQLPDGRIDYRAILNNICSEGVTKENNVIVAMFSWMAGEKEVPLIRDAAEKRETNAKAVESINRYREKFWRELGFDVAPDWRTLQFGFFPYDDPIRDLQQELQKHYTAEELEALVEPERKQRRERLQKRLEQEEISQESFDAQMKDIDKESYRTIVQDQWSQALNSLWTEKDYPCLADGIKKTDEITQKLFDCSHRTQYFHPYFTEENSEVVVYILLPYVQAMRSSTRFLSLRGNWEFANGNIDQAFECAFTSIRFGNTIRREGGCTVEELVGIAIANIGEQRLITYLAHIDGKKDATWILRKKKEFEALRQIPFPNPPKTLLGERLMGLSIAQESAIRSDVILEMFDNEDQKGRFAETFGSDKEHDWNIILRRLNLFYDDCEDINMMSDFARRMRALQRLEARGKDYRERYETEQDSTHRAGDLILAEIIPPMVAAEMARIRAEWQNQVTRVAFALAAYRAEHDGKNPDTLEQLIPKYLDAVPTSPFTGKPMPYIHRENVTFVASTDTYKFDGSDAEVERVIAETDCGRLGVIHSEAHSRHLILVIQK